MASNGGSINFDVNFNANQSSLNTVKQQLQEIKNMTAEDFAIKFGVSDLTKAQSELTKVQKSASQLQDIMDKCYNADLGTINISKFNEELQKPENSLKNIYTNLVQAGTQGTNAFRAMTTEVLTTDLHLKKTNETLNAMATTLKNTIKWGITSSLWKGFTEGVSGAYSYVKQLDSSLNNIRIVTNASSAEMAQFAQQANNAAQAMGTSTTDYTDAALIYYQQGLQGEEVTERTDVTTKLANVMDSSAEEVSSYMTAIWNNFDDGSKSLEYYADVLTKLGATTASSSEEIAEGLSKFASVSDTVGLSYEYATSMLATVTAETRQSADTVGTAFKTILARFQDLEQGATLDDGISLGTYSQALEKVGVEVLDANGNLRQMDDILNDLGGRWGELSEAEQVALAETVAGTRQYTYLVSAMSNWDKIKDNIEGTATATGTLQQQQDTYMESISAHLQTMNAASQDLYNSLFDSDSFKNFIDLGTGAINIITNLVDAIGGGGNALLLFGAIAMNVFNTQLASSINNAIINFRTVQNNALELQSTLDITKQLQTMFSELEQGNIKVDELIQKIVEWKSQIATLFNRGLISQEDFNLFNDYITKANEAATTAATLRTAQSQATTTLNNINTDNNGKPNNGVQKISGADWDNVNQKTDTYNKVGTAVEAAKEKINSFNASVKSSETALLSASRAANNFTSGDSFATTYERDKIAVEKLREALQKLIDSKITDEQQTQDLKGELKGLETALQEVTDAQNEYNAAKAAYEGGTGSQNDMDKAAGKLTAKQDDLESGISMTQSQVVQPIVSKTTNDFNAAENAWKQSKDGFIQTAEQIGQGIEGSIKPKLDDCFSAAKISGYTQSLSGLATGLMSLQTITSGIQNIWNGNIGTGFTSLAMGMSMLVPAGKQLISSIQDFTNIQKLNKEAIEAEKVALEKSDIAKRASAEAEKVNTQAKKAATEAEELNIKAQREQTAAQTLALDAETEEAEVETALATAEQLRTEANEAATVATTAQTEADIANTAATEAQTVAEEAGIVASKARAAANTAEASSTSLLTLAVKGFNAVWATNPALIAIAAVTAALLAAYKVYEIFQEKAIESNEKLLEQAQASQSTADNLNQKKSEYDSAKSENDLNGMRTAVEGIASAFGDTIDASQLTYSQLEALVQKYNELIERQEEAAEKAGEIIVDSETQLYDLNGNAPVEKSNLAGSQTITGEEKTGAKIISDVTYSSDGTVDDMGNLNYNYSTLDESGYIKGTGAEERMAETADWLNQTNQLIEQGQENLNKARDEAKESWKAMADDEKESYKSFEDYLETSSDEKAKAYRGNETGLQEMKDEQAAVLENFNADGYRDNVLAQYQRDAENVLQTLKDNKEEFSLKDMFDESSDAYKNADPAIQRYVSSLSDAEKAEKLVALEAKFSPEELTLDYSDFEKANNEITTLKDNLSSLVSITKDLDIGSVISEEEYQTLISYNSELARFFVLTADGYKVIGNVSEIKTDSIDSAISKMKEFGTLADNLSSRQFSIGGEDMNAKEYYGSMSTTDNETTLSTGLKSTIDSGIDYSSMGYDSEYLNNLYNDITTGDDEVKQQAVESINQFYADLLTLIQNNTNGEYNTGAQAATAYSGADSLGELNQTRQDYGLQDSSLGSEDAQEEQAAYDQAIAALASDYASCRDEVEAYTESLGENGEETDESIELASKMAEALYNAEWEEASDKVAEYTQQIQDSDEWVTKTAEEQAECYQGIADELENLSGIDVDQSWVEDNMDAINDWVDGVDGAGSHLSVLLGEQSTQFQDAMNNIKEDATDAAISAAEASGTSVTDAANNVSSQIQSIISGLDGLQFNVDGTADMTDIVTQILDLCNDADDFAAIMNGIGCTDIALNLDGLTGFKYLPTDLDLTTPEGLNKLNEFWDAYKGAIKTGKSKITGTVPASDSPKTQSVGGGKKGSGGGGKKSSSPKSSGSDSSSEKDYHKDEDIYYQLNQTIKTYNNLLKEQTTEQKRLIGVDLIANLQTQISTYETLNDVIRQKMALEQQDLATKRSELASKYGLTFDAYGNFTNYSDRFKAYNDTETIEDYISDTDAYNKILEQAATTSQSLQTNIDKIIKAKITAANVTLEAEINLDKAKKDWTEFVNGTLNKMLSNNWNEDLSDIATNYSTIQDALASGTANSLDQQETALMKKVSDYRKALAGDYSGDNQYVADGVFDEASAQKDLKKYAESFKDNVENISKAVDDVFDSANDGLKDALEIYKDINDAYDDVNDRLENTEKILELVNGENDYDSKMSSYKNRESNYNNQLASQQAAIADLEVRRQKAFEEMQAMQNTSYYDQYKEAYETINDEYQDALDNQLDTLNDALENIDDEYQAQIEKIFTNLTQALTGSTIDLDDINDQWELAGTISDQFYNDVDRAYQLYKVSADYADAINETTSEAGKARLKAAQQELQVLKDQKNVSEYDIERAEKLLDVTKAQIALMEAQNNKSTMRLRRDANGNYRYVYAQDTDEVEKAKEDLAEALNSTFDDDLENWKTTLENYTDLYQEAMEKIQDIYSDTSLTEQEREDKINNVWADYETALSNSKQLLNTAYAYLKDSGTAEYENLFGVTPNDIEEYLYSIIPELRSAKKTLGDTLTEDDGALLEDVKEQAKEAAETAQSQKTSLLSSLNIDLDDLSSGTDKYTAAAKDALDVTNSWKDSSLELANNFQNVFENMQDIVTSDGFKNMASTASNVATTVEKLLESSYYGAEIGVTTDNADANTATTSTMSVTLKSLTDGSSSASSGFTAEDYANLAKTYMSQISDWQDSLTASLEEYKQALASATINNNLDQIVTIQASFPNVSVSSEIEDALTNLTNLAAQKAYT